MNKDSLIHNAEQAVEKAAIVAAHKISEVVLEVVHEIAEVTHKTIESFKSTQNQIIDILKEKGIAQNSVVLSRSIEPSAIITNSSGVYVDNEHDAQIRKSLLNNLLFSEDGESRLSNAMDPQRKIEEISSVSKDIFLGAQEITKPEIKSVTNPKSLTSVKKVFGFFTKKGGVANG